MNDDELKDLGIEEDEPILPKNKKGKSILDDEDDDLDIEKKKNLDDIFEEDLAEDDFEEEPEAPFLDDEVEESNEDEWGDAYGYKDPDEFES